MTGLFRNASIILVCAVAMTAAIGADLEATAGAAAEHLSRGEAALSQNAYPKAISEFRSGIATIGSSYEDAHTLDDTGMSEVAANSEENAEHLSITANLLRKVLASRLNLLQRKAAK